MGDLSIVLAICSPGLSPLQNPKSPNLTFPVLKNIFYGLMSLCMILYLFSTLNASSSCLNVCSAFF